MHLHHDGAVHSLARIAAHDVALGAWCHVDAQAQGSLPFGVKDNLDVRGMPTRAGSRARAAASCATADAEVVRRLRVAGAVPVGKTVTTEFAFRDPAPTRNPYHLAHSPGGSSSGSAAAVAAGMVPFALATQTAGSLNRPAAYCGLVGIKPSHGLLPVAGLTPLAPSFDTIGLMCRSVAEGVGWLATMAQDPALARAPLPTGARLACLAPTCQGNSSAEVQAFHARTLTALQAAGMSLQTVDLRVDFDALVADHRTVMLFEAYAAHGALLHTQADALQPQFRAALQQAATLEPADAAAAAQRIAAAAHAVWDRLASYDAIVLQPVPETAPSGLVSTGEQNYLTPWTALLGPMVTVPGELDAQGLPLATLLAAAPGRDAPLLALAQQVQRLVDRMPAPPFG